MTEGLFIRLLGEDKEKILQDSIKSYNDGEINEYLFLVNTDTFLLIPGMPFAYWANAGIKRVFSEMPAYEDEGRSVKQGLATANDFRFLRMWWEVPGEQIIDSTHGPDWDNNIEAFQEWCRQRTFENKNWIPFIKGGEYSPYYSEINMVVNWAYDGKEIKEFKDVITGKQLSRPQNTSFYFCPGLTYPCRVRKFSTSISPAGCIFSHVSQMMFNPKIYELFPLCGLYSSIGTRFVLSMMTITRKFEVGIIKSLPYICSDDMAPYVRELVNLKMLKLTTSETSFHFSTLFRNEYSLASMAQEMIDELSLFCFGMNNEDRHSINDSVLRFEQLVDNESNVDEDEDYAEEAGFNVDNLTILSHIIGLTFGRWDIRYATGEKEPTELSDPFAPLPVCPPGMLQNEQGLPAIQQDVTDDYPLRISWSGILVDDEGQPEDIVARVREAIEIIWKEKAGDIEQEACEILGVDSLRDYFCKPGNFFAEHLKRYSKSRRQAPIYWPLSTGSCSYMLWLYYQRLSDQTLYRCVNDYVDPKLKQLTESTRQLRQKTGRSQQEEKELEELLNLEQELQEFRDELLRVAAFWKPDLNDGVQITAAPLWKLFRLPKWRTTLKETWEKLEKGDYDWAHLAYSIWPERVREKCKHDKSLAIAHDLEDIYEEPVAQVKKKGSRGKKNT